MRVFSRCALPGPYHTHTRIQDPQKDSDIPVFANNYIGSMNIIIIFVVVQDRSDSDRKFGTAVPFGKTTV